MEHARLFASVPPHRRLMYSRLRDVGTRRRRAAELANVSYSTAERLDHREDRCGICGRPRRER